MMDSTTGLRPACSVAGGGIFRLYAASDQHERWQAAVKKIVQGNGKEKTEFMPGYGLCENCGLQVDAIGSISWRLYGLCSACWNRAEFVRLPDKILWPEGQWEKPGGLDRGD